MTDQRFHRDAAALSAALHKHSGGHIVRIMIRPLTVSTTLLFYYSTVLLFYYSTTRLLCYSTLPFYSSTTRLLYYYSTTLLFYSVTTRLLGYSTTLLL